MFKNIPGGCLGNLEVNNGNLSIFNKFPFNFFFFFFWGGGGRISYFQQFFSLWIFCWRLCDYYCLLPGASDWLNITLTMTLQTYFATINCVEMATSNLFMIKFFIQTERLVLTDNLNMTKIFIGSHTVIMSTENTLIEYAHFYVTKK